MYINAITFYRVGNYFYKNNYKKLGKFIDALVYVVFHCSVPASATIGRGTYCSHRGIGVVIHKNAVIGDNCVIGANVTVGGAGKGRPGAPKIGADVYLGTGAKILGNIVIGAGTVVGANAVVTKSFPLKVTLMGIPAREVE
jgi:serine O-acetyltransferase